MTRRFPAAMRGEVLVKRIVDVKAQFRSLADPWADTGTSTGRLMPRPPSRSEGSLDHPQARLAPLAVIVHWVRQTGAVGTIRDRAPLG